MNKQFRWLILFVLMLSLVGLACNAVTGGDNGDGNSVVGTTNSAFDASSPASGDSSASGVSQQAEGPQTLDLVGLTAGLTEAESYRLRMEMSVDVPDGTGGSDTITLAMETAKVVDLPAFQSDIQIAGDEELAGFGGMQIVEVGGTTYTTVPGLGCVSGDMADLGAETNPFADLLESGELLGDVNGAQRVLPDEDINGVTTYHYVFDETAVTDSSNELETVDGHIYVSKEEGYLVRLVMTGKGRMNLFGPETDGLSDVRIELNTFDINQPIVIEPPVDCNSFDLNIPGLENVPGLGDIPGFGTDLAESPYPVMANAHDLFILDELVSYQTEDPFGDVLSFYQREMPAAGFLPDSDGSVVTDTVAVLNFTRDDLRFTVSISESEGTVFVQVLQQ